jgi:hypothetical protein
MGPFNLTPALQGGVATASFVNGFRLANGEVLLVFSATGPLEPERSQELKKYRRCARGASTPPSICRRIEAPEPWFGRWSRVGAPTFGISL